MKKLLLPFLLLLVNCIHANVLTRNPFFCGDQDSITITFDATQGNGALNNFTGPVYAHTGVITNLSTSNSNWRYVKSAWGVANAAVLMTALGNNKYSIRFHVRDYYGVPANETILKIAILFRNATGTIVGRNADGSDMFIPIYDNSMPQCEITFPASDPGTPLLNTTLGQTINLAGAANGSYALNVWVNGINIASANDDTITTTHTTTLLGVNTIILQANNGIQNTADTVTFLVNPPINFSPLPNNTSLGINYINDSTVVLALYAPQKNFVYAIGSFNGYTPNSNYYMNLSPDSTTWWLTITGLIPGQEYTFQYLVDGTIKVGDPYSEKILDPSNDNFINAATYPNPTPYPSGLTTGIVSVFQTAQTPYTWTINNFVKPAKTDLVIYELLVRDFTAAHNYQTLIDTLHYLKAMGINAIELMPFNEFEGNESWGYNPSYMMAIDKYYGTKSKLKQFIDACHQEGIAVIQDIVFNHQCGQSPFAMLYFNNSTGKPAPNNPWMNVDARHDFNVCYDINHEAAPVKYWVTKVLKHYIQEYKVDGFRFDLSKGFTQKNTLGNVGAWGQYDTARIATLKNYADSIWLYDPTNYVILEHFANNNEEEELSNYGCMLWGNGNYDFRAAHKANGTGNFNNAISYKSRTWNNPHLIGYAESHDEERLMFETLTTGSQNANYSTRDTATALNRMGMMAAFLYTVPGPKMLWMGTELGYDVSINNPCRTCNKPYRWNYFFNLQRQLLFNIQKAILDLRISHPAFESNNFVINAANPIKAVRITDPSMNVNVMGNCGIVAASTNPVFQNTGWWYDYLTGDSILVSNATASVTLAPGEYHIYTSIKLPMPNLTVGLEDLSNADLVALLTAFPTPASHEMSIQFDLYKNAETRIDIFNIHGKQISHVDLGLLTAGTHNYLWQIDESLPNGIYLCAVTSGSHVRKIKLLVSR